jgi:iron complex transport system substrate-binding protein
MGQRRALTILAAVCIPALVVAAILIPRRPPPPSGKPASGGAVRVASITPAGTDLMIGIGAGDRLVGVSNYDDDREGTAGKPRIGDYLNINWEKLSALGANVLLLQYANDRLPGFVEQRCAELGIKVVNLKLDTVDEICRAMETVGSAIGEPEAGAKAAEQLRSRLDAVAARVKGLPRVRAIVVTSDEGFSLAGPGEFLSEILGIAGGTNAAESLGQPYPEVDREMITTLAPEVVIRLVPDGDRKPQVVEQGDRIWAAMGDVPAVKNRRVYLVTQWYGELPGFRIGEIAEKFAELLHPDLPSTRPGEAKTPERP